MTYPGSYARHLIGVGGVVLDKGKVLLVRLNYGHAQEKFKIPGGLVEPGETLQEALHREILEETGLVIEPRGLIGIRSMVQEKHGLTDVYCLFLCKLLSEDPDNVQPQADEIREVKWFKIEDIDSNLIVRYAREAIQRAITGKSMKLDGEYSKKVLADRSDILRYEQFWISK